MSSDPNRIFQGESTFPQYEEWFYRAREGVAGPYLKREDAAFALNRFINYCQQNRLTGGRDIPAAVNHNASKAWTWLVTTVEQAVPLATWLLGVLFGRITVG
jgi:hypothetical protein